MNKHLAVNVTITSHCGFEYNMNLVFTLDGLYDANIFTVAKGQFHGTTFDVIDIEQYRVSRNNYVLVMWGNLPIIFTRDAASGEVNHGWPKYYYWQQARLHKIS